MALNYMQFSCRLAAAMKSISRAAPSVEQSARGWADVARSSYKAKDYSRAEAALIELERCAYNVSRSVAIG